VATLLFVKLLAFKEIRWLFAGAIFVALATVAAFLFLSPGGGPANSTAFSTASISLTLNNQTGQLAFTNLNFQNMKPGNEVYAPLAVGNTGPAGLTYSMSSVESGDAMFADALSIGIAVIKDGDCTSGTYQGGSSVYPDTAGLSKAAISGRALPPGAREYLCFHVQLPPSAPGALQSESAAATFSFTARQS
jgi:hypothetical protein